MGKLPRKHGIASRKKSHQCPVCRRSYREIKRFFACIDRCQARQARQRQRDARKSV